MTDAGIETGFTTAFGLRHPVALAPMAGAAGGRLAAAVAQAGGLGLLGGGYGEADWIAREWALAEGAGARIGIGFITWRLTPSLLAQCLDRAPRAVMLSFGDPAPFAPAIHAAGVPLICQCQTVAHARAALEAGAQILVAQGAEAGGHGATRGTMTLVPELADLIAARAPQTILLAAGGIADGRSLAASLMLGADGALIGSRFWAASEALVPQGFHAAACASDGDATLRSSVPDAVRGLDWPAPFTIRTMRSAFSDRWQSDPQALRAPEAGPIRTAWSNAQAAGDARNGTPVVGEAVGLIQQIAPAAEILTRMTADALSRLQSFSAPKYPGGAGAGPRRDLGQDPIPSEI
ncbi:NAD(P)H-dependent flavin oxidoreductase [Gemmobacter serpentinus]|uniref:NAD(P)H-dependent flavin oxidoreductase n=1 Tax=Gemmobacter serpentinus TaxID=2652247 RepID=UPI00124EA118|nr:nitronate monooxygenase [Gemmobacter serpentinus]